MLEAQLAREAARAGGAQPMGDACCSLLEPLTDEEGRLELLLPIELPQGAPQGLTIRHLPPLRFATLSQGTKPQPDALVAGLDALFDWFDRQGHSAVAAPLVTLRENETGLLAYISWAFEAGSVSRS
jgi:hypothetical protein